MFEITDVNVKTYHSCVTSPAGLEMRDENLNGFVVTVTRHIIDFDSRRTFVIFISSQRLARNNTRQQNTIQKK